MADDNVIQFPTRTPPDDERALVLLPKADEPEPDPDDWSFDDLRDVDFMVLAACPECGRTDGTHDGCAGAETDPDVIEEADGRWVWEPLEGAVEHEPPVGMVAHRIHTMCKWTYQHIENREPIPQPCCYSVLTTTRRLPGPAREGRSWLAAEVEHPDSSA